MFHLRAQHQVLAGSGRAREQLKKSRHHHSLSSHIVYLWQLNLEARLRKAHGQNLDRISQADIFMNDHMSEQALKAKKEIHCVLLGNLTLKKEAGILGRL